MMDFSPSPEQTELVERGRAFTKEFIGPNSMKYDRSGEFPRDICREAFNQGFMNPHVPAEYGGSPHSVLDHCMVLEEMATGCSGIATAIDANGLSQYPVILAGTDDQKRRFLAPMTEQLMFSAYAVTEPEAGSDVSRVKTSATKIGNDYVLNGIKWWITNGSVASWYFVLARVDDRPTGFIVPADSPWGRFYQQKGNQGHPFYSVARFYTCPQANTLAASGGFKLLKVASTLSADPGEEVSNMAVKEDVVQGCGFVGMLFGL